MELEQFWQWMSDDVMVRQDVGEFGLRLFVFSCSIYLTYWLLFLLFHLIDSFRGPNN